MIDTLYVVHGPAKSGKTLNQAAVCRFFGIASVIHGDPTSRVLDTYDGDALIEVTTTGGVFSPPTPWFRRAKTIKVFSVHQIKGMLGPDWIEPENIPAVPAAPAARKPYVSPTIERRLGFDPASCSPEQWAALVWCVWCLHNGEHFVGLEHEQVMDRMREQVTVTPTRLSADEPRTGDCLELAAAPGSEGRRFFFSNADPKRTIGDPVAWRTLCKTPGATVHLGGLPA